MRLRPLLAAALFVTATAHAQNSADAWRSSIRHALYIDHPLPALHAKVWSTFSPTPGVLADRVTYATADGMIVPAIVYRPDPKLIPPHTRLPGIVVVNGHGSDKFGWYAFYSGMMFAKAGAVVITYDPIGEGERNAQRLSMQNPSPHDADVDPPTPFPHDDWGQRLAGLMQTDLMQAVSYLDAQPQVDPARIGVVAYSMGAFVAGITGAIDPRIHAIILSGGGTFDDAPVGYFDKGNKPCQSSPYHALTPLLTIDGQPARGFILFLLNAQRGPLLLMNGQADSVMDIAHHDAAWFAALHARLTATCTDAASRTTCQNSFFTGIIYPGISHRTSWVNRDGLHWLNAQLHFAFWNTDAKIDAQGTTHISTWITANHVAISPNYFREDREGGLDAVGTGLPGIPRADLMVLSDADWLRLKDQLIYESWAAKTMAAEKLVVSALH
jgi:dienelactone hydrolase